MVVLLGLILAGLQRKKQFNKHQRIKLNNVFCHKIDAGLTSFSLGDIVFLPHIRFFFNWSYGRYIRANK